MHKLSLTLAAACLFFATNVIAEPDAPEKTPEQKEAEANLDRQMRALRALNAANSKQYDEAAKLADQVLAEQPTNDAALYARALVRAHRDSDFDGALKDIDAAIANGSNDAGTHATKAGFLVMKGDAEGATALLRKFVSDNATDSTGWNVLADHYLYMKDSAEAEAAMAKAVELAPTMRYWWLKLAQIRLDVRNFVAARASAERAVELMPDSSHALAALATANMELGELETALRQYSTAVAMTEPDVHLLRQRADCYERMGRLAECAADLGQAAGTPSAGAREHYEYASALIEIHRFDTALKHLDQCLELAPESAVAKHARIVALRGLQRLDDALDYMNNLPDSLQRHPGVLIQKITVLTSLTRNDEIPALINAMDAAMPGSTWVPLARVALLAQEKSYVRALEALNNIENIEGFESTAARYRVQLLSYIGDTKQAETAARDALMKWPSDSDVLQAAIDERKWAGDFPGATVHAQKLVAESPYDVSARLELAGVYVLAGRHEEAGREFGTAIQLNPWSEFARLARAVWRLQQGNTRAAADDLDHCIALRPDLARGLILRAHCHSLQSEPEKAAELHMRAMERHGQLMMAITNTTILLPLRAQMACVRAAIKESPEEADEARELAILYLQDYIQKGHRFAPGELDDPCFDSLRAMPEFKALSGSKE